MSTDLQPTQEKPRTLRAWVQTDAARNEIAAAVGEIMPAEQFIAHMLVAFQDEKIRQCSAESKFRALMECAALGMLPTLGQVVLIPYNTEVKASPQWQGYKALMERLPEVLEVVGVLVHVTDAFSMNEGELRHSYDPFDEDREFRNSKDLRGGYLKIIYRDGRPPKYHMVRRSTIEAAQACAQTQSVWTRWYYEMALKTVYRNAYARRAVPIDPLVSVRLERALKSDDLNLGNDPMRVCQEASQEHIEQAREKQQTTKAVEEEPPFNPPTAAEEAAGATESESTAEAEATSPEAILEKQIRAEQFSTEVPPESQPRPTPESEEAGLLFQIKQSVGVRRVKAIVGDLGACDLSDDAKERIWAAGERRKDEIRQARGPKANEPEQEEMFDTQDSTLANPTAGPPL